MIRFRVCHAWLIAAAATIASPSVVGVEIPGPAPNGPVALVGATLHPISQPPIEDGVLLIENGLIVAVGREVAIPAGAERIELAGRHVYPGLIDAYTQLGLVEIPSVRATRDEIEAGAINPNVRAQVAFNPDSELPPVVRSNGILSALSAPRGGLISGTSALMQLDGWTWEDMTVMAPVALHVNWPRWVPLITWLSRQPDDAQLERRQQQLQAIEEAFANARAYGQARQAAKTSGAEEPASDARWEAMLPVLEGRVPVMIAADELQQIRSAVAFAQRQNVQMILLGGYDAPLCAELLKQHNVPVVIGGVHRLPQRPGDPYDAPYTVAERLRQAGVKFCISSHTEASRARNLPYHAATAAAYGLPRDEALRAVTLSAAEILGAAARLGSLDVGKDATLIVCDGDPLITETQIEEAFVQGRPIDLNNRQRRLWEKYREKYRRLGITENASTR